MTVGELYQKLKELEIAEMELERQEVLVSRGESSETNLYAAEAAYNLLFEEEISEEE